MGGSADWTAGSPTIVAGRLNKAQVSDRKCRLFCAACCRASEKHIKHPPCLELLTLVEAWADDPNQEKEVARLRRAVSRWSNAIHMGATSDRDWLARWSVWCAASPKILPPAQGFLKSKPFRSILQEVIGPDLTTPQSPFPAEWRTTDVLGLAHAIYEERAFDRLPILSDALQDCGCDNEIILSHCLHKGPHFRGCWVIDLILGKT